MPNMDINTEIEAIENAFEGREVRNAIVDALEAIQTEVNNLAPATLISGTEVIDVSDIGAQWLETTLNLPFTPTINTRIIASYRTTTRRPDFVEAVKIYYESGVMKALVVSYPTWESMGYNCFPEGRYYIDWLVLDRGV
jgi:hypothetical protein